jgi:hypothetical protein
MDILSSRLQDQIINFTTTKLQSIQFCIGSGFASREFLDLQKIHALIGKQTNLKLLHLNSGHGNSAEIFNQPLLMQNHLKDFMLLGSVNEVQQDNLADFISSHPALKCLNLKAEISSETKTAKMTQLYERLLDLPLDLIKVELPSNVYFYHSLHFGKFYEYTFEEL